MMNKKKLLKIEWECLIFMCTIGREEKRMQTKQRKTSNFNQSAHMCLQMRKNDKRTERDGKREWERESGKEKKSETLPYKPTDRPTHTHTLRITDIVIIFII